MNKMGNTVEDLLLSRRGRGNIRSFCYDFKWDLPEEERQERDKGVIYEMVRKIPKDIRRMAFYGCSEEVFIKVSSYLVEKSKEVVHAIKPEIGLGDLDEVVNVRGLEIVRGEPQQNPELEEKRKELVFAWAVKAFLQHLV